MCNIILLKYPQKPKAFQSLNNTFYGRLLEMDVEGCGEFVRLLKRPLAP